MSDGIIKEIENNGKLCGYYGHKLVQDATPVTLKKEIVKNTKKPNKKAIAIDLLVVVIIGGALFVGSLIFVWVRTSL